MVGNIIASVILGVVVFAFLPSLIKSMASDLELIHRLYNLLSSIQIKLEFLTPDIILCAHNNCSQYVESYLLIYALLSNITSNFLQETKYFSHYKLNASIPLCDIVNESSRDCTMAFNEISRMGFYNNIHYLLNEYNKIYIANSTDYKLPCEYGNSLLRCVYPKICKLGLQHYKPKNENIIQFGSD
jgi:hypothetical protein